MCETEGDVPDKAIPFTTLNENMLDFLLMDDFKGIFTKENKLTKKKLYES